jgi:hypothetical protein
MMRVTYADDVVEDAVLLAERTAPPALARAFRHARNRAYQIADADKKEAAFQDLHRMWFVTFGLQRGVEEGIGERPQLSARLGLCRVLKAVRPQDEGADLFDRAVAEHMANRQPLLVIRLQPVRLLDINSLRDVLRHELTHVSDMLNPAFGYRRSLPQADGGPSADNIMRDRYRVLWDVTIDGRLARKGCAPPHARELRAREFARAFPMLGAQLAAQFTHWFDSVEPTHDGLVEFVMRPPAASECEPSGRCPLCRFPVASLDHAPERLSAPARARIERAHPGWRIAQGLCAQCLDLYEAQVCMS